MINGDIIDIGSNRVSLLVYLFVFVLYGHACRAEIRTMPTLESKIKRRALTFYNHLEKVTQMHSITRHSHTAKLMSL